MRLANVGLIACLLAVTSLTSVCRADDPTPAASSLAIQKSDSPSLRTYIVHLTEFRMKASDAVELTAEDLAQVLEGKKESNDVEVIETVRMSTLATHESMVSFGRSVAVTTGVTQSQFGKSRHMQDRRLGTIVRVLANETNGKVILKLTYEASRNHGEAAEDAPPDLVSTKYETTLLLKPNVPAIVGGSTADPSSWLLIRITE